MRGKHRRPLVPCPHCGYQYGTDKIRQHLPLCPRNPANFAQQRAALDDGNGCIRSSHIYRNDTRGAASFASLKRTYGSWHGVAEHYGLEAGGRQPGKPGPKIASVPKRANISNAPLADDERMSEVESEYMQTLDYQSPHVAYGPQGLPVSSVTETDREVRCVLR